MSVRKLLLTPPEVDALRGAVAYAMTEIEDGKTAPQRRVVRRLAYILELAYVEGEEDGERAEVLARYAQRR